MAAKKGQYAKVVLTINAVDVEVLELRNWSYSTSVEEIDTTAAGDDWKSLEGGHKSWEGQAEVIDADTFYLQYLGDKATIKFYMAEGDLTYETGTALITGIEKSAPYDDLIEQSLSFKGDGALTKV